MGKSTKVIHDGKGTGLKVEEYRQEDDPSWLAIRLAEHLHNASLHQQDYESFSLSSKSEREKAIQLQHVIFKLKERERNGPPEKVSRMDPLNTYDLKTCKEELATLKKRSEELQKTADEHAEQAQKERSEAQKIQRKLRILNSRKNKK